MAEIEKTAERQPDQMKQWDKAGGARRSKAMPSWSLHFWKALQGVLTRLDIGKKYGINNWKKTLDVPRETWHDGEPSLECGEDKSALGFVRQFAAHGFEHWANALDLVDKPIGAVSEKGDDLHANMYAFGWNVLAMIQYLMENEDLFREAFSQYPVGSPNHRRDLKGFEGNIEKLQDMWEKVVAIPTGPDGAIGKVTRHGR